MPDATPTQAQIAALTDSGLAAILDPANWLPLCNGEGNPVLKPDGTGHYLRPPPAAYYQAAIKRLGQLGISGEMAPGSPQEQLLRAAQQRSAGLRLAGDGKLPPLDTEGDDAATGT